MSSVFVSRLSVSSTHYVISIQNTQTESLVYLFILLITINFIWKYNLLAIIDSLWHRIGQKNICKIYLKFPIISVFSNSSVITRSFVILLVIITKGYKRFMTLKTSFIMLKFLALVVKSFQPKVPHNSLSKTTATEKGLIKQFWRTSRKLLS